MGRSVISAENPVDYSEEITMADNPDQNPYGDIINLPHHVSSTRPRMPMADRAAQFSSFRALSGYGDAVKETARLTGQRI